MKFKKMKILFTLIFMPICSFAYGGADGVYLSEHTVLQIIVVDANTVAATTTVVLGACSGSIVGLGKINGKILKFTPREKLKGSETCEVLVEFDAKFQSAKISADFCSAYSGASCGWEGDVLKKKQINFSPNLRKP